MLFWSQISKQGKSEIVIFRQVCLKASLEGVSVCVCHIKKKFAMAVHINYKCVIKIVWQVRSCKSPIKINVSLHIQINLLGI